jgi:hypothetical protein
MSMSFIDLWLIVCHLICLELMMSPEFFLMLLSLESVVLGGFVKDEKERTDESITEANLSSLSTVFLFAISKRI